MLHTHIVPLSYQGRSKTPAALPRTPDPYVIFPNTYLPTKGTEASHVPWHLAMIAVIEQQEHACVLQGLVFGNPPQSGRR